MAYVPAFASPFLSNNAVYMALTMTVILILTCTITVIANRFSAVTTAKAAG